MVVQECHLWLNLVEVKDVDKARFLDAPISQAGLFGNTVEGFAQQFSAVQQQTEAIQHTCPGVMHDAPSTAAPGARPQSAHRRGRPLASCPPELLRPRPNRYLGRRVEPLAGERCPPRPSQAPSRPGSRRSGSDVGKPEMLEFALYQETARKPSPGGGPGGESSVSVPPLAQGPATRFSSPGDLPSSTAFSRCQWQSVTPLFCARRLLSSWQKTQSSRSLQPRGGRGFTALTSSYPRNVVAFDQS